MRRGVSDWESLLQHSIGRRSGCAESRALSVVVEGEIQPCSSMLMLGGIADTHTEQSLSGYRILYQVGTTCLRPHPHATRPSLGRICRQISRSRAPGNPPDRKGRQRQRRFGESLQVSSTDAPGRSSTAPLYVALYATHNTTQYTLYSSPCLCTGLGSRSALPLSWCLIRTSRRPSLL